MRFFAMVSQFNFPTTILYGVGALTEFAGRLKAAGTGSVLLVTDPGLVAIGIADRVIEALKGAGVESTLYEQVHPNPVEPDVTGGAAAYRDGSFDGIVALGGGSPMDAAKAIAVLAVHDRPMDDFDLSQGGTDRITNDLPPIYAIPTTAGTGSEVGRSCVVVSSKTHRKTVIFHPTLLPKIAALEPALTVDLPPAVTAATGIDAFTHGLEAYFSLGYHPMADSIALGCMELVIRHLPVAVAHGDNLDARGGMLIAATMGATAFQKGLGTIHSLAHPMSTHYGIHHGLANALLLEPTLSWQLEQMRDRFSADLEARYGRVAELFGSEGARPESLPARIANFVAAVGVTDTLPRLGLKEADLPGLVEEAFDDPCHRENPIPMTAEDLEGIYRSCL